MRKYRIRILAAAMIPVMLGGCGAAKQAYSKLMEYLPGVKPGETISSDSKWINSDIDGAVDERVSVSEKDDFHTATNREWILETHLSGKEYDSAGTFVSTGDVLKEQNLTLFQPAENFSVDPEVMSQEDYDHLESLSCGLAGMIGDWETRNERGAEPVRKYVENIQKVTSLDELTAYLLSPEGETVSAQDLVSFGVNTDTENREQYSVLVMPCSSWSLKSQDSYGNMAGSDLEMAAYNEEAMEYVLGNLGFSGEEIRRILRQCYRLEGKLADHECEQEDQQVGEYLDKEVDSSLDLEGIRKLQGAYPLTELLKAGGLDESGLFTVYEKEYLRALGKIYSEKNLEDLKSYYIVHAVLDALPYLDRKCYDLSVTRQLVLTAQTADAGDDGDETPKDPIPDEKDPTGGEQKKENGKSSGDKIVPDMMESLIPGVLDEIYVARYCTAKEKQELSELTQEMISFYRQMLLGEDWLTEETRQKAVEKLDAIQPRILYPDQLADYSGLDPDFSGTLLDAVNAINDFEQQQNAELVNQPIDRSRWSASTRIVNAFYSPMDNSINIFAGIMADGYIYGADLSREEKLGRIGMIIGHEITHAFDTTGYQYDKDGLKNSWWTPEDEEAFRIRASKVAKFYSAITPIEGVSYRGETVQGEAIADMGGLKCALAIAKEDPDFDYQAFFRAFAGLWKSKTTYMYEIAMMNDEHPLGFLRTNVTVQQFDEFLEAFDIQKGDGMYLDPDKRITVW